MTAVTFALVVSAIFLVGIFLGSWWSGDGEQNEGCNGHHWEPHDLQPSTQLRTKSLADYRTHDMKLEKKVRERCEDCGDERDMWKVVGKFDHDDIEALARNE